MTQAAPPLADGRYQLIDVLGVGGMATVYRAYDARLQVPRAIKVLLPSLARKRSLRTRFETEASTMALLEHPHIVRVYDVGIDGDRVYIVMELVSGGSLLDRVKQHGALPPRMAVRATLDMLRALQVAHAKGVVHRDIKPHNVLITSEGELRLTDFGIARIRLDEEDDGMTKTGAVMGTWGFMAPEQRVDAKSVDVRADIYSVGATLYAILTDKTPVDLFVADMDAKLLADLPDPLAEIIRVSCKYEREERYADPMTMVAALEPLLEALPPDPADTPPMTAASPQLAPIDPTSMRAARGGGTGLLAQASAPHEEQKQPAQETMVPDLDTAEEPVVAARPPPVPVSNEPSGLTFEEPPSAPSRLPLVAGGVALLALLGIGAWSFGGREEGPVQPEIGEPESTRPEVAEPEVVEPEAIEPELVEPEAIEPEVVSRPPEEPAVVELEPETAPIATPKGTGLRHTPPATASAGSDLGLTVDLPSGDYTVTLSYKVSGGTYAHKPMHASGSRYSANISLDESYRGRSLEYYIKAQPRSGGEALSFKSGFGPQKVPVR